MSSQAPPPSPKPRVLASSSSSSSCSSPINFPYASQPDIIRANQKDIYYQKLLQDQVSSVFRTFFGTRTHLKWQNEVSLASDAAYRGLTTAAGSRTLGEEYCDIMHVQDRTLLHPSATARSALAFLYVFSPYLFARLVTELNNRVKRQSNQQALRQNLLRKAAAALSTIQKLSETHLHSIHLAIFYFSGAFYHISNRLLGIRYIFLRKLRPNEQQSGYELLGTLIVIQLLVKGYLDYRAGSKPSNNETDQDYNDPNAHYADKR
ncbi:hypothetical protein PhCBS80983_g05950 [Powellomyces hirtus]|uniref:RING-type E3 ubiquitin transferase n=1 Tax=Powellomyces hirtus TaxID=109895 RepID=A0A507DRN1_9FUNG|nr:hypothetical protein PhCBS80983_g05950 [Powellomyces hirtus]